MQPPQQASPVDVLGGQALLLQPALAGDDDGTDEARVHVLHLICAGRKEHTGEWRLSGWPRGLAGVPCTPWRCTHRAAAAVRATRSRHTHSCGCEPSTRPTRGRRVQGQRSPSRAKYTGGCRRSARRRQPCRRLRWASMSRSEQSAKTRAGAITAPPCTSPATAAARKSRATDQRCHRHKGSPRCPFRSARREGAEWLHGRERPGRGAHVRCRTRPRAPSAGTATCERAAAAKVKAAHWGSEPCS